MEQLQQSSLNLNINHCSVTELEDQRIRSTEQGFTHQMEANQPLSLITMFK